MAQDINNFPQYIEIVLGSWWTGYMGLNEDDVITLTQFTDGAVKKWSEDGTATPNAVSNRIIFYPRFASSSYSVYMNFGSAQYSIGYAYATGTSSEEYDFKELFLLSPSFQLDGSSATNIDYNGQLFKSMNIGSPPTPATLWEYLTSESYGLRLGVFPNLLKNGDNPAAFNTGYFPIYNGGPNYDGDTGQFADVTVGYGYNTSGYIGFEQLSDQRLVLSEPIGVKGNGSTMTFDIFFRYEASLVNEQYLFAAYAGASQAIYARVTTDHEVQFAAKGGGAGPSVTSSGTLTPGSDYRLTFTYSRTDGFPNDSAEARIYINGVIDNQDIESVSGDDIINNSTPITIGSPDYVGSVAPGGRIYTFQYFDTMALTTQASNMYNKYNGVDMSGYYGYRNNKTMSISQTRIVPVPAKKVGNFISKPGVTAVPSLPINMKIINARRIRQRQIDRVKVLTYK